MGWARKNIWFIQEGTSPSFSRWRDQNPDEDGDLQNISCWPNTRISCYVHVIADGSPATGNPVVTIRMSAGDTDKFEKQLVTTRRKWTIY